MSSESLHVRQARLAKNQALFRAVNERVDRVSQDLAARPATSFICECSYVDCNELIDLAHEEYEAIRQHADHFLVVPGHEILEVEYVAEANERYAIVVKIEAGKRVAIETNPR